jgi:hypothetical protein
MPEEKTVKAELGESQPSFFHPKSSSAVKTLQAKLEPLLE